MEYMFQGCSSLQTLFLPNFDTSSVTLMNNMFYDCTSLKYLIISNFNFDEVSDIGGILYNLKNLEYIGIYNISDSKGLFKTHAEEQGLNNKENLTVCQNNSVVITNPNATYDCCNIINDNLVCNNIQTTIPIIQTTNPIIKTNNPMIQTNIPLIQNTIPKIQNTIPQIQATIPRIKITTPQIEANIPQIQTIIQTNIPRIQTTSPKITNERTLLILLGFNYFKLSSLTMSFYVLFAKILNDIYSNLMKVLLIIDYN